MTEIFEKIAKNNGVSVDEVRREIEAGLKGTAYDKNSADEAVLALAKKAKRSFNENNGYVLYHHS